MVQLKGLCNVLVYPSRTLPALLVLLLLAACSAAAPATPTATNALPSASPAPSDTPAPSPTSPPQAPKAILLAPPDADQTSVVAFQSTLEGLAQGAGLRFEVRASLSAADLQEARIVVAVPPATGLEELAAASPETQFLAVGVPDLESADNLTSLSPQGGRPDQLGFLAGFIAAVISDDWRTGFIGLDGDPASQAASQGFDNGMTYFCGLCLSVYPPFPNSGYPIFVDLPAGAGLDDWQVAMDALKTWQVETVFVYPGTGGDDLLALLADEGFHLIVTSPFADTFLVNWAVTLGYADPLQLIPDLWGKLLAGEAGSDVPASLRIVASNPDILSPGRLRMADEMLAELLSGFIDTGVELQSGGNP